VGPRDGLDVVEMRKNPCPCQESNPSRPARSLVTILTDSRPGCEIWTLALRKQERLRVLEKNGAEENTRLYPKVSGLAAWSENCK